MHLKERWDEPWEWLEHYEEEAQMQDIICCMREGTEYTTGNHAVTKKMEGSQPDIQPHFCNLAQLLAQSKRQNP